MSRDWTLHELVEAPATLSRVQKAHKKKLLQQLNATNDLLLDARSTLMYIKKGSPLDDHITLALQGVGRLRLAITEL